MSLKDSAKAGRNIFWTRHGIDGFGGGLLGWFLMKLTERHNKRMEERGQKTSCCDAAVDSVLDKLEG